MIALIAMILAACSTKASFDPGGTDCPPVKTYSKARQKDLKAELVALPPQSVIPGIIADYKVLRDQVRACRF